MRGFAVLVLLCGVGCARQPVSRPAIVHATPPSEEEAESSPGRVVSIVIPPGFDREARYRLSHCRANCGAPGGGDRFTLDVVLQLERPNDCRPPDPKRPTFEDLVPSPPEDGETPDTSETEQEDDSRDEVLEFRPVELLGMRGTLLSRRSRDGDTWFEAGAVGQMYDVEGERRVLCLEIYFAPYDSDTRASATFHRVLASLSSKPSASPPSGFSRFPFATGQVDLPDGVPFYQLGFGGPGGYFEVRSYRRTSHGNLSKHLELNYAHEKPELLEPHSSRPYLDGTLEQARARLTVSQAERRIAIIRRPQRNLVIFESSLDAPRPDGAPLDGARWTELVERVAPLFQPEGIAPRAR